MGILRNHVKLSNALLVALALLGLSSCNNEPVGTVSATPEKGALVQMTPPPNIAYSRAVNQDALILNVTVNGESVVMEEDPTTGVRAGRITLPAGSAPEIIVKWSEGFRGGVLALGEARRNVDIRNDANSEQQVRFLQSDFDFSMDDDNDERSNLQERNENSDPLDPNSPGVPVVLVDVVVRIQVPDARLLDQPEALAALTAVATFNGDELPLVREGSSWTATTRAGENSNAFVSVDFYRTSERRLQLSRAQESQDIGTGAEFNFATETHESAAFNEDRDDLPNLEEIIQGHNPLDSNSPAKDPCETSQFAVGCTTDTDNDGKPDSIETETTDTDGDGIPNYREPSSVDADDDTRNAELDVNDNDPCIPSVNNIACQNKLRDSDGDGKTDIEEGDGDRDNDGMLDRDESSQNDADNDGESDESDAANQDPCIPNAAAQQCLVTTNDFDNDGKLDVDETTTEDTDGDGIPDYQESFTFDGDSDGTVDELDPDNNDPCLPSTDNTPCQDLLQDSDGDNKTDVEETLTLDSDGDTIPDYLDSAIVDTDNDGLVDEVDSDNNDACVPDTANSTCQAQLDGDGDGVPDATDNCSAVANPDQTNSDSDAQGDACDVDDDNDTVLDAVPDNCPIVANPAQSDTDGDGMGDACDNDDDNDGVLDVVPDNCPLTANANQNDNDADAAGDACDDDDDNDGILDAAPDNCPFDANPLQTDSDMDDIGDACDTVTDTDSDGIADAIPDNCIAVPNPMQTDTDMDGMGDACDDDDDNDTVLDAFPDNCPLIANLDQADNDFDLDGDACDLDDDNDGIPDAFPDNCPFDANPMQTDSDMDDIGDVCDPTP